MANHIYFAEYPLPAAKEEPTGGIVNYIDDLRKHVYEEKAAFVEKLADALRGEYGVTNIVYTTDFKSNEFVTIFYIGDNQDVINVHMNSHEAIFREIYKQLDGPGAYGFCRELRFDDVYFGG